MDGCIKTYHFRTIRQTERHVRTVVGQHFEQALIIDARLYRDNRETVLLFNTAGRGAQTGFRYFAIFV